MTNGHWETERRKKFLQFLRTQPTSNVRNLLALETEAELNILLNTCPQDGDEAMRDLINQELDNRKDPIND